MADRTLLDYWFVLYKRRGIILAITLSAMVTAGVISMILAPVYEAKAVFFVPKESEATPLFGPPRGSMIRSTLSPDPAGERQKPFLGILKAGTLAKLVQKEFPQKSIRDIEHDTDLNVSNEYMLEVYARDKDPQRAAGIANSYVKYFNQLMSDYSLPAQGKTIKTLKSELDENEKKLAEARRALEEFQVKNRTANLNEETKQLISMRASFESQLQTARVQYGETVTKILTTQEGVKKERGNFNAAELVVTSPLLESLRTKLADTESRMAQLKVELKESHPEFVATKGNYEEIRKNITNEVQRIIKSEIQSPDTFYEKLRRQLVDLYVDKEKTEATIRGTQQVLQQIGQRTLEIPRLMRHNDALTADVKGYEKLIDVLRTNLTETMAQTKRAPQVAVVVDEALPPGDPVFPVLPLNLLVGLTAGLVGAIFYAFFVDYLESTRERRLLRLLKEIEASQG